MDEDNKPVFYALNEAGEEVECEVIAMYACESGHKNYLVYTDHSKDEDGSEMQFASVFDPTDEEPALYPIQSDDDWQIIDLMLSSNAVEPEAPAAPEAPGAD